MGFQKIQKTRNMFMTENAIRLDMSRGIQGRNHFLSKVFRINMALEGLR